MEATQCIWASKHCQDDLLKLKLNVTGENVI